MTRLYLLPLAVLLVHVFLHPLRVNHDVAQFLLAGRTVAEGGIPGVDAIDTNPPLIMWLSAVPALLERVLPLHTITLFHGFVLAGIVAATEVLRRLLRAPRLGLGHAEVALVLGVWALAHVTIYATNQFGQRDQLFAVAFLPYFVLRWLRWQGDPVAPALAVGLGVATGVGAAFRPELVALALLPELGFAARHRRWRELLRPELIAVGAVLALYAGVLVATPALREAYFGRWFPMLRRGYAAYDSGLERTLMAHEMWCALAAAALPWVARVRGLARALSPLAVLAAVLFVVGQKAWPYRAQPMFCIGALLVALSAADGLRRLRWDWRAALFVVVACWFGLRAAWETPPRALFPDRDYHAALVRELILRHSRPGDGILFLTPAVAPGHPAVLQTDRRMATRYLNLFPIALLAASPDPAADARFLDELRADLAARPPAMIFVQRQPWIPGWFDVEVYLRDRDLMPRLVRGMINVPGGGKALTVYAR